MTKEQQLMVIDAEDDIAEVEPKSINAGMLRVTPEEQARLLRVIPDEDLDILPTGEVYLSQVHYRRILNDAFGVGQWALVPRSDWRTVEKTVCRDYALFVRGCYVGETIGEQEYHANNPNMTWATACEGAKSNALMRVCKDLGIASQCWDRRYTEQWKRDHAVKVFVKKKDGKTGVQWRRKDADPFYNETGIIPEQGTTAPKTGTTSDGDDSQQDQSTERERKEKHEGEYAVVAVEFTPDRKYTGLVTLENMNGQQRQFQVWSETAFEVCRRSFSQGTRTVRVEYTRTPKKGGGGEWWNIDEAVEIGGLS